MGVVGLHHAALAVEDIESYGRAVAFYRDVLGFPVVREFSKAPRRIALLDAGNTLIEIVMGAKADAGMGPVFHICVETSSPDEVDSMLRRCEEAGCAVLAAPEDFHGTDEAEGSGGAGFGFRNAFCTGPAGERLEFFCDLQAVRIK